MLGPKKGETIIKNSTLQVLKGLIVRHDVTLVWHLLHMPGFEPRTTAFAAGGHPKVWTPKR